MNKTIVLYSNKCPNCNALKMLLEKAKVPFIENNSIDEMLKLGFTKVPILSVDGEIMDFSSAKKWIVEITKERSNEE